MQRPRNRQGRDGQSTDRGRGRGRGGFRPPRDRDHDLPSVPNIQQVTPGAFVSIVLKVDQPIGREVQGVVQDVLTRDNHPRGIKVRLGDGRVGRVQRLCSEEAAKAGAAAVGSGLGRNGEVGGQVGYTTRYRDVREGEDLDVPSQGGYSLEDFLPLGHPLRNEAPAMAAGNKTESQTCPVCGEFEGDEGVYNQIGLFPDARLLRVVAWGIHVEQKLI